VDQAPASVYTSLLDEGRYLCSVPTMYRLLRAEGGVRERRRQATHPASVKPELLALGPNQVWSWDITKLVDWLSKHPVPKLSAVTGMASTLVRPGVAHRVGQHAATTARSPIRG
jgi:hypothetical protein